MKAVVKTKHGKGNVGVQEVDIPQIGPNEVLIKSKAAPIGSDVRVYKDDPVMRRVTKPPVILGSENSGEIVQVGKSVTGWRRGDRVVCELVISSCGQCRFCRMGRPFMCPQVVTLGRGQHGSFADYYRAPAQFLHRIPDNLSFEEAAIAEDTGVCIAAIDENQAIHLEDTVAILGPGPIGLLSLQIVKSCGAAQVIVSGVETDRTRLELAKELGADYTISAEKQSLGEFIQDLTKGEGVDVVVLATGSSVAVNQAFNVIKSYGNMVVIGFPRKPLQVPWQEVAPKSMRIIGSWGAATWLAWEKALRYLCSGSVKVDKIVTHKFGLEQWKKAFDTFDSGEGIKVELIPGG